MLNSGEAAEKSKNKSDEKAFIRLYNLRNHKEKNNLLKANANKAPVKKKTLQERDKYLQNLYKEGLNFIDQKFYVYLNELK